MTRQFRTRPLQFFMTAPGMCPYLPGRWERKVFAHVDGPDGPALNDALTHAGFRRSQSILYRPACEACEACLSARVPVSAFRPSKSQKRALKRNDDLRYAERSMEATDEQFALFSRYLESRHSDGGMAGMSFGDYAMMTADTPTDTRLCEYRTGDGRLIAVLLIDRMVDGVSLVYSFFDPNEDHRSLGAFMILDQIARTAKAGEAHVYLGYWVRGSRKMAYKALYRPLEVLRADGWGRLRDEEIEAAVADAAAAHSAPTIPQPRADADGGDGPDEFGTARPVKRSRGTTGKDTLAGNDNDG